MKDYLLARDPKSIYQPPEEQLALFPNISGNALNGLGETEIRPPKPIFWHHGVENLPHKALQDYYLEKYNKVPELQHFQHKYGGRGGAAPPVSYTHLTLPTKA